MPVASINGINIDYSVTGQADAPDYSVTNKSMQIMENFFVS